MGSVNSLFGKNVVEGNSLVVIWATSKSKCLHWKLNWHMEEVVALPSSLEEINSRLLVKCRC